MDGVQIYTLGQFRILVGDQVRDDDAWQRKRARQLLKCLLSQPRNQLKKERAVELFWPEATPEAADASLRSLVFGIRQVIDRGGKGGRLISDGLISDASRSVEEDSGPYGIPRRSRR